jgi:hypothetical protein
MCAHGNSHRIGSPRINSIFFTILPQQQLRIKSTVFKFMNEGFHQFDIELFKNGMNKIVRQWSRRSYIFYYESNGLRFGSTYDNR